MAASQQTEERARAFYGRSYPRAAIVLNSDGVLADKRPAPPPLANAPLIEWALNADEKLGGAKLRPPEKPLTPEYAYLGATFERLRIKNPNTPSAQLLDKAKAHLQARKWSALVEAERDVYVKVADEAARKYEKELAEYTRLYPKWHEGPPKTRPGRPLRPFDCFVEAEFKQRRDEHPHLAYLPKYKAELAKSVHAEWLELPVEGKEQFEKRAEEDRLRWEVELDSFPEYRAQLEKKREEKQVQRLAAAAAANRRRTRAARSRAVKARDGKAAVAGRKRALPAAGRKRKASITGGRKRLLPRATAAKKPRRAAKVKARHDPDSSEDELSSSEDDEDAEGESDEELDPSDDESENGEEEEAAAEEQDDDEDMADDDDDAEEDDAEISEDEAEADDDPAEEAADDQALMEEILDEEEALEQAEDEAKGGHSNLPEESGAVATANSQQLSQFSEPSSQRGSLLDWAKKKINRVFARSSQKAPRSEPSAVEHRTPAPPSDIDLPSQPLEGSHGDQLLGVTFYKEFNKQLYRGKVVKFIRQEKWYGVSYDDGDYEELEHQELLKLLEWNSSQHDSIAETVQSQEANAASAGPAKAEGDKPQVKGRRNTKRRARK